MKILLLIHEYPPVGGGGGQSAFDIANEMARQGNDILVLTTHYSKLLFIENTTPRLKIIRFPCFRKEIFKAGFFDMTLFVLFSFIYGLFLVPIWKPDLIHAHFAVPAGASARFLSKIFNIPYVLTCHLGDIPGGVPVKTDRWFKFVFSFTPSIWHDASAVVAVSSFTKNIALKYYPVNIKIIPNGVKRDVFSNHKKNNLIPKILFVGRFVEQKNPIRIIEALHKVRDLNWEFKMIGDGELRARIEDKIFTLGLQGRIQIVGWATQDEINHFMSESDLLFMPSFVEGLPVVGVNALAAGLAILASNIGGFSSVVEEGRNGFMVNPDSVDDMANRLRYFLTNPDLLNSAQEQSLLISEKFELTKVAEQYFDLFKEIF